jgi:hypothetical protein
MSYTIPPDSTDVSIEIMIVDSTTGAPETGVTAATAGLDIKYRREGAANVSLTETALATPALTDPHLDGGIIEIGNGVYRLDLPDAAVAAGVEKLVVHGAATGMLVLPVRIQLENWESEAGPDIDDFGTLLDTKFAANAATYATEYLTTVIPMIVADPGDDPTVQQLMLMTGVALGIYKMTVIDTTITVYAADGTTVLMTWTTDSDTTPTTRTRAT